MNEKRILLVDDDENLVDTFKTVLQEQVYVVDTAATGRQALEKADKAEFDLGILDVRLPDMRGDEVAKVLKKRDDSINIVLITGPSSFQDRIDAIDDGIYDILLKPVAPEELLRIIREVLSG